MKLKRILIICLLLIFVCLLLAPTSSVLTDTTENELWSKAVAIAEANPDWIPGKMYMKMEELKKDGSVKNTTEIWQDFVTGEEKEIAINVVKVLENGENITEKYIEEREEEKKKENGKHSVSVGYSSKDSLFSAENQKNITIKQTTRVKDIGGQQCVEFEFEQQRENLTIRGKAWLNEESGVPVELEFTPDPLPKHVKHMDTIMRYMYTDDGAFYPVEMTVDGAGGFLFFKKHFRTVMQFSDYWKKQNIGG